MLDREELSIELNGNLFIISEIKKLLEQREPDVLKATRLLYSLEASLKSLMYTDGYNEDEYSISIEDLRQGGYI